VNIVTALRLKRGWSQKQLAGELGTSQPHVARIEAGTEDLRLSTIVKLAGVLGVQPYEIVQGLTSRRAREA
jgi:transcriptional regulator with XRE-family HTH domain